MTQLNLETIERAVHIEGPAGETAIARDLKLNLKRLLTEGALDASEALSTLLATATSSGHTALAQAAEELLGQGGLAPPEAILEAKQSAAIMGMLNIYYRSRHFIGKEEEYRQAGLRMTALAKPVLGKSAFELLAFAVSCINGCQVCVSSHEKTLKDHGVSVEKIHDAMRLAAVVNGLASLKG